MTGGSWYNLRHEWHPYYVWGFEGKSYDTVSRIVVVIKIFRSWELYVATKIKFSRGREFGCSSENGAWPLQLT